MILAALFLLLDLSEASTRSSAPAEERPVEQLVFGDMDGLLPAEFHHSRHAGSSVPVLNPMGTMASVPPVQHSSYRMESTRLQQIHITFLDIKPALMLRCCAPELHARMDDPSGIA